MTPGMFEANVLPNLKFTVESDRGMILGLYTKTFTKVISCATELSWTDLGWEYELQELMPVLLTTKNLARLNLSYNKLRGANLVCSGIFRQTACL